MFLYGYIRCQTRYKCPKRQFGVLGFQMYDSSHGRWKTRMNCKHETIMFCMNTRLVYILDLVVRHWNKLYYLKRKGSEYILTRKRQLTDD